MMSAPLRFALLRSAHLTHASLRFAPLRSAPLRFALLRSAHLTSALLRSALLRSALLRFAPMRFALLRFALLRFAPLRSGGLALLRSRPSFQITLLCRNRARCSSICHRLALPEVRLSAFSSIFEQLAKTVFGGRARRGWTIRHVAAQTRLPLARRE
jgi:hypothetical protein